MEAVTRSEAKAAGKTRYFTGKPCKRGHVVERLVSNCCCVICSCEKRVEYFRKYPEMKKAANSRHYKKYKIRNNEAVNAWRAAHPEKHRAQAEEYRLANPAKARAKIAKRRARRISATPDWLTDEQHQEILAYYEDAQNRAGDWHVDHIIPLQGRNVSGLHVPWNLRVITAKANWSKGNRLALD